MNQMESMALLLKNLRQTAPLIHCITNHISINDCANAVLALGARPIMAEHPDEAAEITGHAQALVLNLGNISASRMEAMRRSACAAGKSGIPIVLDPAGVGCSPLRRAFFAELAGIAPFSIIRANSSELRALCSGDSTTDGVDVAADDKITRSTAKQQAQWVVEAARRFHCVASASGEVDIVSDGQSCWFLSNGDPMLGQITGTGCMSSALAGACCAGGQPLEAAVTAAALMGICGEQAAAETRARGRGSGTFHAALLDALSTISSEALAQNLHMEGASL